MISFVTMNISSGLKSVKSLSRYSKHKRKKYNGKVRFRSWISSGNSFMKEI